MSDKVFINQDKNIQLVCPGCGRQWIADASQYYDVPKEVRLKVKCKCGHSWSCILEKRKYFRKGVSLSGRYIYQPPGRGLYRGEMVVVDISLKGLRLKLDREWTFKAGEFLDVEFQLDNKPRKWIRRKVIVRNMNRKNVGAAFLESAKNDPDIGFYLL
jgi:hypothetical protein